MMATTMTATNNDHDGHNHDGHKPITATNNYHDGHNHEGHKQWPWRPQPWRPQTNNGHKQLPWWPQPWRPQTITMTATKMFSEDGYDWIRHEFGNFLKVHRCFFMFSLLWPSWYSFGPSWFVAARHDTGTTTITLISNRKQKIILRLQEVSKVSK